MQLADYIAIVWRRKWVAILTVLVTMIVVITGTYMMTPVYTASATLRVAIAASGSVNYVDASYADRLINTNVKIATSQPVLDKLQQTFQLTVLPKIHVAAVPNTELFKITVEGQNPTIVAYVANGLASILVSQSQEFYAGTGKSPLQILDAQLTEVENELTQAKMNYDNLLAQNPVDENQLSAASKSVELRQQIYNNLLQQYEQAQTRQSIQANALSIMEPASIPTSPSKPNKLLNYLLGLVASLVGGLGLVFLFENLDTTLYTSKQIEGVTNLTPIGKIPISHKKKEKQLPSNGNSPFGEAFHHLSAHLLAVCRDTPFKSLLIMSTTRGEGKSLITAFLANALAQAGKSVVVVDCDMRSPKVHHYFGVINKVGLGDFLRRRLELGKILQPSHCRGVSVITSGVHATNPATLLENGQIKLLIEQLSASFDYILLEGPALLSASDSVVLMQYAEKVLFIARRGFVHKESLQAASRQLADIKAEILGLVVNGENMFNHYYTYRPLEGSKKVR